MKFKRVFTEEMECEFNQMLMQTALKGHIIHFGVIGLRVVYCWAKSQADGKEIVGTSISTTDDADYTYLRYLALKEMFNQLSKN